MGNIISLAGYRTAKKKAYLRRYETQLTKFLNRFMALHLRFSFESISHHYMTNRQSQHEMAWDYCDFRETLKDAMDEVFGHDIWLQCQEQYWFDDRYLSKDELIDRVVSQLILGPSVSLSRAP